MPVEPNKKIKVVRIIARLNIGGPAIHTILLSEGLPIGDFDSVLVTGRVDENEGDMLYFAGSRNIHTIIIPQLQRKINLAYDLVAFIKILLVLKKEKPDIIHTHTAKAGALGRLTGLFYNTLSRKKCRLVHTFHGTVLRGYFGNLKSIVFIFIERFLAYFTDLIIVVSESIKKELLDLKIGNHKKITIVSLGLDIENLSSIMPRSRNSGLRIGVIGRLVPVKNHKMLLEAAQLLLGRRSPLLKDCQFCIVGDGELRRELELYALRLGIKDSVQFYGWQRQIAQIYNLLDLVVLTSLNEGTPLSLIEAMSAAKPIIATDVGGVSDLFIKTMDFGLQHSAKIRICDNGILCNSGDTAGLTEAISLLVENPQLREKMGKHGRAFAKDKFSKERLIKDIELLYNCLKIKRSS
jgi:glycosyltransferase involved in cell wall biosynthesis